MNATSPDFEALAQAARDDQSGEPMNDLWRAVYTLEQWHFVGRGETPNITPFIGIVEEKPFLMAFTDADRAHAFAVKNNLSTADGAYPTLSVAVDGVVGMVGNLQKHNVFGILFNDGPAGFFAPLSNVATMFEHHLDQLPAPLWEPFVKGVKAANHPHGWQRLIRRLGLLERWFFLTTAGNQIVTTDVQGQTYILMFTDEHHVNMGLKQLPEDQISTLTVRAAPPSEVTPSLKQIFEPHQIKDVVINLGGEPVTCEFDDLERAVSAAHD